MKQNLSELISKVINIDKEKIISLLEVPPSNELGDYALPCFSLSKELKKSPVEISNEIYEKIKGNAEFEKIEVKGPYLNFFIDKKTLAKKVINQILKEKEKYGFSNDGKGKTLVIDLSSPNIAKPFGIGHLRSTIIGNAISNIYKSQGYKTIKINYLGDWGTQFGKLIVGYKKSKDNKNLKSDPINHLLNLYIDGNKEENKELAREWFKKLENGDKEAIKLWKLFKELSLRDFKEIYSLLDISFDVISGESYYNKKMDKTIEELNKKNLLKESEGALGVDLEKQGLGFCLIKKSDGATLYATRDITAAIDRYEKYGFDKLIYEVGQEQRLHFQQVFKVLELMGYDWANKCEHIYHGLYLGSDGKRFRTREGNTVFMKDIFDETINIAKKEISKREKISKKDLEQRAKTIALSAIFYGDLKNFRVNDIIFDINRFVSFEGDTGPYLLYSYARARSILRKSKKISLQNIKIDSISEKEKALVLALAKFQNILSQSAKNNSPNLIANYSFELAQIFNEFYHSEQVIGSEKEKFKLALVQSFSIVMKNSLNLLGIKTLEKM